MRSRFVPSAIALAMALSPLPSSAQVPIDLETTNRIKEEGLQRSQALELYHTLTDVYGARLTGSPEHTAAARWARDRFAEWGLADVRLEAFEFGRGWTLQKVSAEMVAPRYMPLIAYAEAWAPSIDGVLRGRAVYLGDRTADQIRSMASELRGAIVLTHQPQTEFRDEDRPQPGVGDGPVRTGNPPGIPTRSTVPGREMGPLLRELGVGVMLSPTTYRDGTVGVLGSRNTPPDAVPSLMVSTEAYNMIARLAMRGVPVELRVELRVAFDDDPNTYNVLGDIPGTDPQVADEVVLIGAHLDSWHTASGATDNGDGALAVMEAARILAALAVRPRRTIRFALWSGEEQGLLGSRAYVSEHLASDEAKSKLQVYLNDDPGSGRSLGFYMEENQPAKEIFDAWLEPLSDLNVGRNVIEGIGSTDHVPFDQVGLPGFNAIKDFEAYDERTRHTNADWPERMSEEELKQQAIFLAHFAWQAAQMEGRIPRKPVS